MLSAAAEQPLTEADVTSHLSEAELAELDAIRSMRDGVEPFAEFVSRISRRFADVPPHLAPLYDLIQRSRREQVFATISEPPRHGKTTSFSLGFAYRTAYDPACNNFYATYAQKRSDHFGLATMRVVEALGVPLDKAARAKEYWRTMFGGGLQSTSLGGQITGEGANGGLVVVDDLIKGWKASRSKNVRDEAWNFLVNDVMSRLEGGASLIVMNTRWHDDDVVGRIMKNPLGLGEIAGTKPWIHLNLPAIHDGRFNPLDERLHPEKATPLWLDVDSANPGSFEAAMRWYKLARARGELAWWALYQGTPRQEGSKVFGNPARYTLPMSKAGINSAQPFNWNGKRGCVALDPAATESTKGDHSAVAVVAMEGHGDTCKAYVVDAFKDQISVPDAARLALRWAQRYRLPLVVEGVAGFKSVRQIIEEIVPGIAIENAPAFGSKFTRAQPASGAWNDGRFMIPVPIDVTGRPLEHVEWIDQLLDQGREFTGDDGVEDDMIDAIVHGFNYLHSGNGTRAEDSSRW